MRPFRFVWTAALIGLLPVVAEAGAIVPSFSSFGSLPAATFGGSGIPNNAVAIRTITDGANTITLGLTAFGRYFNPQLTNDGAGTFFAGPGSNTGDPNDPLNVSRPLGALWSYGLYINIAGGGDFADYTFQLLYELDPAAGTDESDHGQININAAVVFGGGNLSSTSQVEDSQNLLFSFFSTGIPFVVTPPTIVPFDPNAAGEYTLALRAYAGSSTTGTPLGESAISVVVTPEPTSLAIWGLGSLGLGLVAARRRRKALAEA